MAMSRFLTTFAKQKLIVTFMQAIVTNESVQLTLPYADLSFLRTISKKMGWSLKLQRKSGIEKGLEDIRKGNVFHAKDSDDLIKQILG